MPIGMSRSTSGSASPPLRGPRRGHRRADAAEDRADDPEQGPDRGDSDHAGAEEAHVGLKIGRAPPPRRAPGNGRAVRIGSRIHQPIDQADEHRHADRDADQMAGADQGEGEAARNAGRARARPGNRCAASSASSRVLATRVKKPAATSWSRR